MSSKRRSSRSLLLALLLVVAAGALPAKVAGDNIWRESDPCEGTTNGTNCNDLDSGRARHWSDLGGTEAVMWFVDSTPAGWPVLLSASVWNRSPRILITWESADPPSQCPRHCVNVSLRPRSHFGGAYCVNFAGDTHGPIGGAAHFTERVRVHFNNSCANETRRQRRELACHELGHALGVDGRPRRTNSCMRVGRLDLPAEREPNAHDFEMLRRIYDHND